MMGRELTASTPINSSWIEGLTFSSAASTKIIPSNTTFTFSNGWYWPYPYNPSPYTYTHYCTCGHEKDKGKKAIEIIKLLAKEKLISLRTGKDFMELAEKLMTII